MNPTLLLQNRLFNTDGLFNLFKNVNAFTKRLMLICIFLLLTTASVIAQSWQTLGPGNLSPNGASSISMAFSGTTPYVAYADNAIFDPINPSPLGGQQATVAMYNGSNWTTVGTANFSAGSVSYVSLAFNGTTPYVAYSDGANGQKATVMMFDGANWVNLGAPDFSAGEADYTSLVFNGTIPYIVYSDAVNSGAVTVMKFDGANWVTVGNAGFSAGLAQYTSLAFNGTTPYVAYMDYSNNYKATVMMFDGANWVTVGNAGFSAGEVNFTSLAFNGTTPYVIYTDGGITAFGRATVMKFDGSNWVAVGPVGFSADQAGSCTLVFNGTTPYAAFSDRLIAGKTTVMMYNGSSWVLAGEQAFSPGEADEIALAFNGGVPYVASGGYSGAFVQYLPALLPPGISYTSPNTYVTGAAIVPLTPAGSGVATAGYGVPATVPSAFSALQSVAVDATGNVYTADGTAKITEFPINGSPVIIPAPVCSYVAVDAAGNLYVDNNLTSVTKIAVGGTQTNLYPAFSLNHLTGIALDTKGNVFVCDQAGNTGTYSVAGVYELPADGSGIVVETLGWSQPQGIAVDAAGDIFESDANGAITELFFNRNTPVLHVFGFYNPQGLAADAAGNLYVADYNYLTEILAGTSNKVVIATGFSSLMDVAIDAMGKIYTGDQSAAQLNKYAPVGGFYLGNPLPAGLNFDNNTGIISGTPTTVTPAANYTVTGYNSAGNASAIVNIGVTLPDVTLSALTISNGTLSPAFVPGSIGYKASVGNGLTTMTVTPTATSPAAIITVQGQTVVSGSPSQALTLVVGANSIPVVVTDANHTITKTYTLTISEARSANNNLAVIATSAGYKQGKTVATTLTETVPYAVSSLTVTPTVDNASATVTISSVGLALPPVNFPVVPINANSYSVPSGSPSPPINLTVGQNTITVVVTAQNLTIKTYTLTVTRSPSANSNLSALVVSNGTLAPAFGTATSYLDYVGSGAVFSITPTTADPAATLTVNGVAATSGTATAVPLTAGSNTVTIVVTSQNSSTKTYTLVVNQARSTNDNLFSFRTSGGFAKGKTVATTLTETVVASLSSITVTPTVDDTTARVTVNGSAVTSGTASVSMGLNPGNNTITIIVTAQNQTTKTYTLIVQRGSSIPTANPLDAVTSVEKPIEQVQLADDGLLVHQGVSPNGDGINDYLQIDNISRYPNNNLKITTRNGQLVYEAKGYDNATKTFDGHSNKTGQMQLPGTYFYELDYTVGGINKHKTGYLVLKY